MKSVQGNVVRERHLVERRSLRLPVVLSPVQDLQDHASPPGCCCLQSDQ